MTPHIHSRLLAAAVTVCLTWPLPARAGRVNETEYVAAVEEMLAELAPDSARAAAAIRDAYRPYVDLIALDSFEDLQAGLANGGLVPLPSAERFNVRPRLEGTSAIGEKDLEHQASYLSERAAAIGCLLDIASRVTSGPIEVTSLVRHLQYQDQLRMTNANATTDVPTHALGLAFDIAIVNTPLETVLEIRDVLRQMSEAGDILVIAERQQRVFHVVPQPSRLGWYTEVYARALAGQPWARAADASAPIEPAVVAAIGSLQPVQEWAAEWWAADNVPVDIPVSVHADPVPAAAQHDLEVGTVTGRYLATFGDLLPSTRPRMCTFG